MILLFGCALLSSCLKPISDEGLIDIMTMSGYVYENASGNALENIHIIVTNGEQNGCQCSTESDGSFHIQVTYNQLGSNYFLRIFADSLYKSVDLPFPTVAYGTNECLLPDIYVEGPEPPHVSTDSITNITPNTAICWGRVNDNGRSAIRERGICWGPTHQPTISNNHISVEQGSGAFVATLEGLTKGTAYYARAYARNGVGISYGNEIPFTTPTGAPTVGTSVITNVTSNSISCWCNVTSDNGHEVTSRGVCYSTISNPPTLLDNCITNGSGTGEYSIIIPNLQSNTIYYIRAFATNSEGTGFGETKEVRTN